MTTESTGPSVEARACGNTYQVYVDGNVAGTFTRHTDAGGTPYFNAWFGAGASPRSFTSEEEVTAAVVSYYRTGR